MKHFNSPHPKKALKAFLQVQMLKGAGCPTMVPTLGNLPFLEVFFMGLQQ